MKKNKNEKGFALVLAILLLVVMSVMGATLVAIVSNDFKENDRRDYYQQALYTAETAINAAKKDLQNRAKTAIPTAGNTPWNSAPNFCRPTKFKSLDASKVYLVASSPGSHVLLNNELKTTDINENKKFSLYRYYYFITYAPDSSGNTLNPQDMTVSGTKGGSSNISESSSYKGQSTTSARRYSIFACGYGESDTVVSLDVIVLLKR
jgi:type II secretory pathway pseudopilin PulG